MGIYQPQLGLTENYQNRPDPLQNQFVMIFPDVPNIFPIKMAITSHTLRMKTPQFRGPDGVKSPDSINGFSSSTIPPVVSEAMRFSNSFT